MPSTNDFLEMFGFATDAATLLVLCTGVVFAFRRAALPRETQTRWATLIIATVLIWYGAILFLARRDFFKASDGVPNPAVVFAVVLPTFIGLWSIVRSRTMAVVIDASPASWLIAVQFYRVVGVVFLVLLALGRLPAQFAVSAGTGDLLTGLLALPVAWMVGNGLKMARPAAYAWNTLGIADLMAALPLGFLTSPGKFQLLAIAQPNLLASVYPLVMIPAFLVPLSLILHGICLWKLRRLRVATAAASPRGDAFA